MARVDRVRGRATVPSHVSGGRPNSGYARAAVRDRRTGVRMTSIRTVVELEEALSRPSQRDIDFARELEGDILILGASGKMGPSLTRLCRRACEEAGTRRRVIAVSRRPLDLPGIESISCDLLDRAQVSALPDCANVLY